MIQTLAPYFSHTVHYVRSVPLHTEKHPGFAVFVNIQRSVKTLHSRRSNEYAIVGDDVFIRTERTIVGTQHGCTTQNAVGTARNGNKAIIFAIIIICIGSPPVVRAFISLGHVINVSRFVPCFQIFALIRNQSGILGTARRQYQIIFAVLPVNSYERISAFYLRGGDIRLLRPGICHGKQNKQQ